MNTDRMSSARAVAGGCGQLSRVQGRRFRSRRLKIPESQCVSASTKDPMQRFEAREPGPHLHPKSGVVVGYGASCHALRRDACRDK